MCAAIAPVTLQAAANVKASRTMVRSIGICGLIAVAAETFASFTAGSMKKLSGRPIRICARAQAKQVSRQPIVSRPKAVSGHPTVLAKPASRVIPVIDLRALSP